MITTINQFYSTLVRSIIEVVKQLRASLYIRMSWALDFSRRINIRLNSSQVI